MNDKLKAWIVSDNDGEWSELLHAETRGKARSQAAGLFSGVGAIRNENFLYFRVTRFTKADDRAFTAADRYEADGDAEHDERYISECYCVLCQLR